ncbi:hypothetical protein ACFQL4_05625 [Halosimplex aquaticum]
MAVAGDGLFGPPSEKKPSSSWSTTVVVIEFERTNDSSSDWEYSSVCWITGTSNWSWTSRFSSTCSRISDGLVTSPSSTAWRM